MTVMQAEDVFVREEGIITVDAASGLLTTGSAMQLMTGKSKFTQVYINGEQGTRVLGRGQSQGMPNP